MNTNRILSAALFGLCSLAHANDVDLNLGLVAHLAFDGSAQDSSGNGNNGTINGLSWTTDRFGNANSALQFDRNGYVQINNDTLLNDATSGAITGWFKSQLAPNELGFVVGAGDSRAGLDPFALALFGNGDVTQSIFTQTTRGPSAPDRDIGIEAPADYVTAPQDEWASFVMQFASIGSTSIFQLYLNGVLVKQLNYDYSLKVEYDQPMPVQIGALTGFSDVQFRGAIDDVRFYDRALNTDEIAALDTPATASVPELGVTALYLALGFLGLLGAFLRPNLISRHA